MDLNEIHKAQISRFGAFFKGKRARAEADIDAARANFVDDNLSDQSVIFNHSDAVNYVNAGCQAVQEKAKEDLELLVNLAGGFVSQLLKQAEESGLTLQVDDISLVEDGNLVNQISALSAMNAPPLAPKPRNSLGALGAGGGGQAQDVAVLQQLEDLKEQCRQLTDRNMQMQAQVTAVSQEKTTLGAELEQVKGQLKQHVVAMHENQGAHGANAALYERQLASAQQVQAQYQAEVEQMRREMQQRLADSQQFRDMKALMKRKTEEIKLLKGHLIQLGYAPPASADDEGVELAADSD